MGLNLPFLEFIVGEIQRGGIALEGCRLLELGNQIIRDRRIPKRTGKEYFANRGTDHTSVDLNGRDGALPVDLSVPDRSDSWMGRFDVITNSGTSEHVEPLGAQYTCFANLHHWLRVGGLAIHLVPDAGELDRKGRWKGHCNHYYSEDFFRFLASENGYEIQSLTYLAQNVCVSLRKTSEVEFTTRKDAFLRRIECRSGGTIYPGINDRHRERGDETANPLRTPFDAASPPSPSTLLRTWGDSQGRLDRTAILNVLADVFAYDSYLEIGVFRGCNYRHVTCRCKVSVDPSERWHTPTFRMTSDEFFAINAMTFDLVFIDGLHRADQMVRDVENALRVLEAGGTIVCHDVNPRREIHQRPERQSPIWTGDCWKGWVRLRESRLDLEMLVVNRGSGCGVIRRGRQETLDALPTKLTWQGLARNRREWLGLVDEREFLDQVVQWKIAAREQGRPVRDSGD